MLAALLLNLDGAPPVSPPAPPPILAGGGDDVPRRRPRKHKGWSEKDWREGKQAEHALLKGIEDAYQRAMHPERFVDEVLEVEPEFAYTQPPPELFARSARALYEEMLRQDEEDVAMLLMSVI